MTHWYEQSFGEEYLALYPHRDLDEARADIAAILNLIAPPKTEPLLDLCCGAGRHLHALHEAGFTNLIGIDLSQTLLDVARRRLDEAAAGIRLLRSDMRHIPFHEHFSTVLSLFTSFGYFSKPGEDESALRAAYDALRPGGSFLMDTLNRPWTIAHLTPYSDETVDGTRAVISREISTDGFRVEKRIQIESDAGPPRLYHESVRMYAVDELREMLERSGFVAVHFYGTLGGRPYDSSTPRMVAIARKPTEKEPR